MFRYFSRLIDKHEPIISIAVFLEKRTKNNSPVYNYSCHGTEIEFKFNSIYVAELDEIELSRSNNPFAKILLAAKLVTQKGLSVQDIFEKKKAIARQLLGLDLNPEKIRHLPDFLKGYVRFDEKEINTKFDEELNLLTNKSETMGITEQILSLAKEEGKNEGKEEKTVEISKNLIKEGVEIKLIHKITSMPIRRLEKLKKELLS